MKTASCCAPAVVDRAAIADRLEQVLRATPGASRKEGKPEEVVIEEAIADVAAARHRRRK